MYWMNGMSERRDVKSMMLSLVIPVYNEEQNIAPLIARLQQVLAPIGCSDLRFVSYDLRCTG